MSINLMPGPRTAVWRELATHATRLAALPVRELFKREPQRFERFSREAVGLLMDFSRQRLDEATLAKLVQLADAVGLKARIEAMWRGEHINPTEDRAVLHVALRQPPGAGIGGTDIERQVLTERERMLKFAEAVRSGAIRSSTGEPFALVVNIGIGGSDLGPAMAVQALRAYTTGAPRCEFVSNIDGVHLAEVLESADPQRTLFIVSSKTFTTLETRTNADTARAWLKGRLGEAAVPAHFAAVSVNTEAMNEFGVHPEYRFEMWDWVGGRYSIWSSIGVSVAVAVGRQNFLDFLAGGHAIDEHFRSSPWSENLPALMGLIGVWNINFLKLPTLAVLPYDDSLRRFPAYLQQLEMESNGKSVMLDGSTVECETAAVIWGEPGNNAQHSFFQLLHQGTPRAALDFLLPVRSSCGNQPQQNLAIASCLAQAEAFMAGQSADTVRAELEGQRMTPDEIRALIPHKVDPGSRPSTLVLFPQLDPQTLGKLIALYEHSVFTQSVVWGIDAFDQWGVELGKKLTQQLVPAVEDSEGGHGAPGPVREVLARVAQWRRGT
ncbi:MAG TPA: glucose-6-phosphate isomerase [Steroidobacteraceae bacterium]|jgi:glucose-6-phosphate isomerase|nr:glucose-6-phosphate isomerase [Steroidobacteraceae bacterium]